MKTIDCPLQSNARILGDHPAIICGNQTITYKDLNNDVWAIAGYLQEINIQPRDRVAVFAPTSLEYIKILYAVWRIGAIACPMSTHLPEKGLNERLKSINASYLVTTSEHLLTSPKVKIKKINLLQTVEQIRGVPPGILSKTPSFTHEQDATIVFTSGSQGQPKAAMLSYANHFYSAMGANSHIPFGPQDRWFLSLPLYHVGGLAVIFRVLLGKGTLVIANPGEGIGETIDTAGATHVSLVATQLFRLLNTPEAVLKMRNLRAILLGGSAIPDSLIRKSIENGLPIYTSYGLTEMASQVATTVCIRSEADAGRAKILPYREVAIGEKGEILVKGKTLFKGYVIGTNTHLPEAGEEGWFATGDLGCVVDGEYLKVSGRKDNLFISGGENIRPEEIERYLCQFDAVEHAIVVPKSSEEFGYRPVAFIKGKDSRAVHKDELIKKLQKFLPKFMTPDEFYLWPASTEQGALKIDRSRLRKLIEENNPDLKILD